MDQNMVRLQRFELKIRLLGFQDTPDSAPMVPRPSEPKSGGCGERQIFDFTVFGAAGSTSSPRSAACRGSVVRMTRVGRLN